MLSMALFVLASILICALLWSLKVQASLRSNIQFLQENLDHSRSKLADYETQVEAARLLCLQTLWLKDNHLPHTSEAGMCKWWGPKLAYDVVH